MICSKCCHHNQPQIRIRNTPTFYHSPIFDPVDDSNRRIPCRCSATYHSTIFDGPQIHKSTKCCCKTSKKEINNQINTAKKTNVPKATIRCSSASKMQRQADLHPHTHTYQNFNKLGSRGISQHQLLWYNPDKEVRLMNCSNCSYHGLPKQRKLIELQSSPFEIYPMPAQIEGNCEQCCYYPIDCEEINNDSLDVLNQQKIARKQQPIQQYNRPKTHEEYILQPEVEQPIELRQNLGEKNNNQQTRVDPYTQISKYQQKVSAKQTNKKLSTIDTGKKTVKCGKSNGNQATGQPMFWAVTKSKLK